MNILFEINKRKRQKGGKIDIGRNVIIHPIIQRKFRQMIRLFEINERKVCGDDLNVENDKNTYGFFDFFY